MNTNTWTRVVVISIMLFVTGCGQNDVVRNDAVTEAANKWWGQTLDVSEPEKAGTITPPRTITLRNGRKINVRKHVETKAEEADQAEDARWASHMKSIVRGFGAEGSTFLVLTNLKPTEMMDAQELCHMAGGFIWSKDNRHFGLDSIAIVGANNDRLSYRVGLAGNVH